MSSDPDSSFTNDNLQEQPSTENKIPRSPAVAAYESYAAWRKKKFPPRTLEYKAEDYALSTVQNNNANLLGKNHSNSIVKKSSYFPNEDQYSSENQSNRNNADSVLPRSSYFTIDSKTLTSETKNDERKRTFVPTEDTRQKYSPQMFQENNQELSHQNNPNIIRSFSSGNKISRKAQHYLKLHSNRSDNSSPSSLNSGYSTKISNPCSPTSQYSSIPKTVHGENVQNFHQLRQFSNEHDPRLSSHNRALQPVRHRPDQRHSFPSCCPAEHKNREPDNGEMVKGLLKLIDNQNEQIKNLQSQLDRLLSIHEEVLKEKSKCKCTEISRQNPQICMQAYNAALLTKSAAMTTDSYSNQAFPTIAESNQISNNEPTSRRNIQFDENSKKALMERKVSIGVMTSFEFTLQNNPFNIDTENHPLIEEKQDKDICKESIPTNVDHSKRKQNLFSLMPSTLENIIEDSESHLSSSQQPSSNCLSSCKSGSLQIQNGRSRNNAGCNTNYTNDPNHFNKSKSPDSFNSIQNSSNTPNCVNNRNIQNKKEFAGQVTEFGSQKDANRDFYKQIPSPLNQTETGNRVNTVKNATRRRSDEFNTQTRTPNKDDQSSRKEQIQPFSSDNIRSDDNFQDESLILSGGQLEVRDRVPPSPAPSIHVDMQEYSSEDGSVLTKKTPKVGWTFYNNVLGQVNHILQNSPLQEEDLRNGKGPELQELDKNVLIDTVKAATMDQLKKLGISFVDNETKEANANKKVTFDTSYYSRPNPEVNMMQGTSILTETNTSMHMKALAMKYLKEEQISDAMQHKQKRGALKNLMLSNVQGTTNMSFATMRYLQRYQLLPESMNGLMEDEGKENFEMPQISENPEPVLQKARINLQSRPAIAQTTKTSYPSKILDISTLKQQPKLL